jgi:putative nucleotidyltransferase with HDIG domain
MNNEEKDYPIEGQPRPRSEVDLACDSMVDGFARALDMREKEPVGHTHQLAEFTVRLARALGVPERDLVHIRRGALLHDIGKMGVPERILLKAEALTEEEWQIICMHPQYAYDLLSRIEILHPAIDIPYCHHEKWDGTGYPRRLKGDQIPLAARIFVVVDIWDALTTDLPYRKAWPNEKATQFIREQAGIYLDPEIVKVFLSLGFKKTAPMPEVR